MSSTGNRLCGCILLAAAAVSTNAAEQAEASFSYVPKVHGVVRGRWEILTDDGQQRFQVRNARVNLGGNIAPWADYYVQADFCDKGKVKILDAWARLKSQRGWLAQLGQFRMPFGVDPFRAPANYYFANRSVLGNQVCNFRAVGVKAGYTLPAFPLTVEAGVFNTRPIGDHDVWRHGVAGSAKIAASLPGGWKLATGIISVKPGDVRSNMVDAAVTWQGGRWIVEGEYICQHYARGAHNDTHAYNFFADYAMPLRAAWFNRLSFQGRLDGMTSHMNLSTGAIDPARNRITLGSTISYIKTSTLGFDLRINYEHYLYHSGAEPLEGQDSKVVAEAVFRF